LEPDTPYVQIIEEGIVQVGDFAKTTTMMEEGKLTVLRPPMENIVASKLLRASPKDLEDIAFILSRHPIQPTQVQAIINGFPNRQRETASENMVYLAIHGPEL